MVNLLRGILTFLLLQNFLTAVLLWQVAAKGKETVKTEKPDTGSLFIVYTKNRFSQILLFDSRDEAAEWLRKSTRLSEDEVQAEIKTPIDAGNKLSVTDT